MTRRLAIPPAVEREIIAVSCQEDIAAFEHNIGIRCRPPNTATAAQFRERKLAEMEEMSRMGQAQNKRSRPASAPDSWRETQQMRPTSAMTKLETIFLPPTENRAAVRAPRHTRAFTLALSRNKTFCELDRSYQQWERRWHGEQLAKSKTSRKSMDAQQLRDTQSRRSVQRERFQTMAYSRFVAAARRKEPHAVDRLERWAR